METKESEHTLAIKIKDKYNFMDIVISDEIPYTLYYANDFKKILNIADMTRMICGYSDDKKYKKKGKTNGGIQNKLYLNYYGIIQLLTTCRKIESVNFCSILNLNLKSNYYTCIEFDTIKCILDAFKDEIMISQYKVKNYHIDLYFLNYKLAIECDEYHTNIKGDIKRENEIKDILNCTFIRYKPYDKNFNIFLLINEIYKSILKYKSPPIN